jgi:dTDP-4-dehydrorhamnose 3,5-epimerase
MPSMSPAADPSMFAAIEGVQVIPLSRIPDERGTIFHMLRRTDPHFIEFGEIYFTSIYRDVVKGWHRHRLMTLNYACIAGRIKLVLYDDRRESPTRGGLMERFLGPDDYSLVVIPPGIWTGFKGMAELSLVANCATHPHDPSNTERIDPIASEIPYDWAVKHR